MTRQQAKDRRVQKTERLLRDAIGTLIHEKSYDSIAVREILQRANVGRSAFYAHFSNKDALLAVAIEQTLHEMPPHPVAVPPTQFEHVVGFSYRVFEHIDGFRHTATAMKGRKSRTIVHHHLRRVLLERVTAAIRQSVPRSAVPAGLLAEYVVGTIILVLNWWVDSRSTLSARQINDVFRSFVLPALAAAADENGALRTAFAQMLENLPLRSLYESVPKLVQNEQTLDEDRDAADLHRRRTERRVRERGRDRREESA